MNKRGALELSANFLVIMILSVVMFGFGLYFTYKIFDASNQRTVEIDQATEQRMEELFNDGSRIVIPFQTKTIRRGSVGVYAVGVLNTLDSGGDTVFTINPEQQLGLCGTLQCPTAGYDKDGQQLSDTDMQKVQILYKNPYQITLKKNQRQKFALGVDVANDAKSGTYIVDFSITYADAVNPIVTYGDPKYKLYIVVP
jgi:hypothetical protein